MFAHLLPSTTSPTIELSFDINEVHASTGEPLREWVKKLPGRTWMPEAGVWHVYATGVHPEREMRRAGFDVVGPDGELTSLLDLVRPVAVPGRDGLWEVYPRLGGRDLVVGHLPLESHWDRDRHCYLVPPALLAPAGNVPGWLAQCDGLREASLAAGSAPGAALRFDATVDGLRGVPVSDLVCVDERVRTALSAVGVNDVHDLLHYLPRRYLDLSAPVQVAQAPIGVAAPVIGTVTKVTAPGEKGGMLKACVRDESGTNVWCRWFNAEYLISRLKVGSRVVIIGKVETFTYSGGGAGFGMTNPLIERVDEGDAATHKVIGFYPASEKSGLSTWTVRRAALEAVSRIEAITDPLPEGTRAELGLPTRLEAYRSVHDPDSVDAARTARDRIAFDELLRLQLVVQTARMEYQGLPALRNDQRALVDAYVSGLPFDLTTGQREIADTIAADMAGTAPMHRLLLGDVGSGKTALSVMALLHAVSSGRQAAMIAPTEILATQHALEVQEAVAGLTRPDGTAVSAVVLTNKVTGKARKETLAAIADGRADIVIGTHAVLADAVSFRELGCVVIDEQHRFGSEQRKALRDKASGHVPDTLYCTATPIPRTAVMTAFGDLACSTLTEMPPGRSPVTTTAILETDLADAGAAPWNTVLAEVEAGHQAFVVCPLVASSEKAQDASAHATAADLRSGALAGLRIDVVTGKDHPDKRAETMAAFAAGEIDVLVATTVIEVGVNVPNATVMVVLGADRFGLAQLHQLRGRVGRGAAPGTCHLVAVPRSAIGKGRIEAMCSTTDGFALAELDANLRGVGHVTGTAQSGSGRDLAVAGVVKDAALLATARDVAADLVGDDPTLSRYPSLAAEISKALTEDNVEALKSA